MKPALHKPIAIFIIAVCVKFNWAVAQSSLSAPKAACISVENIRAPQLYGTWQVIFTNPPAGLPTTAVMLLEQHQEFSDSLRGSIRRDLPPSAIATAGHAPQAALAGDVDDGFVILDESSNNISISGTWNGRLVEASCGREVKGVWKDTSANARPDTPDVPFTMLKRPGW